MQFASDHLRTLAAIVDEGSFESAADELRITSPAVSQRIKALEASAGRALLRRTTPVTPTGAGEVVLKLARQVALAEAEASAELTGETSWPSVRVAVNADSLATWALPALIAATREVPMALEILRDDETSTAELLRNGSVMAAITTREAAVRGCAVDPLGDVVYHPVASPDFASTWFPHGVTREAASAAPIARFDRKDSLLEAVSVLQGVPTPPTVFVPGSREFMEAIAAGVAWGFVDDAQARPALGTGRLVRLSGVDAVRVPLYWQQWRLPSRALDALAVAVRSAARDALDR